nr:unnamed protein product [Callosobruchus chinensis]
MRTPIVQVSKDHLITTEPVDYSNEEWKGGLGCLWFNLLQRNKDKIIIINGDTQEHETRGSLLSKSIRVALLLRKYGIRKGDVVTFALNIHQHAYAALAGSLFIGAIPTFIEPFQNSDEAAHLLRAVKPKLVICSKDGGKLDTLSKATESIESDVTVITLEDSEEFKQPQQAEANFVPVPVEDNGETAVIFFSSGSTGLPKGICIRHSSLLPINELKLLDKVETPVVMTFDSLYWGTDVYKFISALKNDAILLITPTLDPHKIWQRIEKYKLVDPETGKSLGPNQQGEFRVKKKTMMNGYYNLDSSNEFDEDEFFRTGDILYYDEDYCFFYVERMKELIIYQGYHVIPAVIESRLMEHPAVKRAAVIGKKHDRDGELPTAFIEIQKGYENFDSHELKKFVDDKMPDTHKLRGGIIALDKIPTTPSNKVKRATLKKLLESEYQSI